MRKLALLVLAAAVSSAATPLVAQTTIPYNVLQGCPGTNTSRTYTGLNANNMSMTASAGAGGLLNCISGVPGIGSYPGLWFGGNNQSARYTFTFSAPVTFVEFLFTAHSAVGRDQEDLRNFSLDAGTYTSSFTNVQYTSWDGSTLTTSDGDGRALLGFGRTGGGFFNSISFDFNVGAGLPNGTVIEQMRFTPAITSTVPEPSTWLMLGTGLVGLAVFARKRRKVS